MGWFPCFLDNLETFSAAASKVSLAALETWSISAEFSEFF